MINLKICIWDKLRTCKKKKKTCENCSANFKSKEENIIGVTKIKKNVCLLYNSKITQGKKQEGYGCHLI